MSHFSSSYARTLLDKGLLKEALEELLNGLEVACNLQNEVNRLGQLVDSLNEDVNSLAIDVENNQDDIKRVERIVDGLD